MKKIASQSYWQTTAPIISLPSELPTTVDVAVIGGGITGTSICYWLAREGINVALLEKHALAYGATGRNGGFVVAGPGEFYHNAITQLGHDAAKAILQLTIQSKMLLKQVIEEEEIACEYQEPGSLRLAITQDQLERLAEEAKALETDGLTATIIDHDQIKALIQTPLSCEIIGGQFLPGQGIVHSAKLVQGLTLAALHHGAHAYQAETFKLVPDNHSIRLETSSGNLNAGTVIVAINAWTSKILPTFSDIIVPVREQILSYAPTNTVFTTSCTADLRGCEYWQQRPDGSIIIGGCSGIEENENFMNWEYQPTTKTQEALEQILPRLFPCLEQLHVTHRWAGLLDYVTDNFPIVDQVPDMPGVFTAAGFSGHGMPFGTKLGLLLTKTISEGNIQPELKPYHLNRPTLKKWESSPRR